MASSVLRRHFLIELLLCKVLGMPWSQIHNEAHAMEHTIFQDEMLERLQDKLKHPATCPHGNPLPGERTGCVALGQAGLTWILGTPAPSSASTNWPRTTAT